MKLYYTLVQPFSLDAGNRGLDQYLTEQQIEYHMGADFAEDLARFGYKVTIHPIDGKLMKIVVVLIDEHELSAIMLSLDEVSVVTNRPFVEFKNKIRKSLKWFVK